MNLKREGIYDLTNFFPFVIEMFSTGEKVNDYDFIKEIDLFKNVLKSNPLKDSELDFDGLDERIFKSKGEAYENDYHYDGHCFYKLGWDLLKIEELIKEKSLKVTQSKVDSLIQVVDHKNIYNKKVEEAIDNKKPVIVGNMINTIYGVVLIDGNHRVVSRSIKNVKNIDSIVLSEKIHAEAILTDFMRNLFKIHYNIRMIWEYMIGSITKEEMEHLKFKF